MPRQGTLQQPEFKTRGGVVLRIAPVNAGAMQLFMALWEKDHEPIRPPKIILKNGQDWDDTTDEYWRSLHDKWHQNYNNAMMDFILKYGVLTTPPSDWQNPYEELAGQEPSVQKAIWLTEILYTDNTINEYTELTEAIMGLNRPTASGLAQAEKK